MSFSSNSKTSPTTPAAPASVKVTRRLAAARILISSNYATRSPLEDPIRDMVLPEKEVLVGQEAPANSGLAEPGRPVFYPKVGHCIYRGIVEDPAAPGTKLVELEDIEEGSRILVPMERVPNLGLRPAGAFLDEIKEELSSQFEPPLESEEARQALVQELINEGSPRGLAKALKRLHLARQSGLSRDEEKTRRKIRSWLAAEVALGRDCTRAEAQALITRILQETMAAHRRKEREEAKERRRVAKAEAEREAAEAAQKDEPASR